MNHRNAAHKVTVMEGCGTSVWVPYKGYTISLALDGEDTIVFQDLSPVLFTAVFTDGSAVKECINFIDNL